MDLTKIDNIKFEGVDNNDYPDFCDAYICSAEYNNVPMTDGEIDELNNDKQFVHDKLILNL